MKQTKIYLSGKISGLPTNEYTLNFHNATYQSLVYAGMFNFPDIINPIEIKPLFGIKSYWFYMAADIYHELKCTHVAFQKNWIDSRGARIEMIVAILFNKKIIML